LKRKKKKLRKLEKHKNIKKTADYSSLPRKSYKLIQENGAVVIEKSYKLIQENKATLKVVDPVGFLR
jgi:hypothetical protein